MQSFKQVSFNFNTYIVCTFICATNGPTIKRDERRCGKARRETQPDSYKNYRSERCEAKILFVPLSRHVNELLICLAPPDQVICLTGPTSGQRFVAHNEIKILMLWCRNKN